MKTIDPTLQAAADAIAPMRFAATSELLGGLTVADVLTAAEMERLLAAARAAIAAPVLALHAPRCGRCTLPVDQCDGHAEWRDEDLRHDPLPECTVCVASWADEATEAWPCPTVRALGVIA